MPASWQTVFTSDAEQDFAKLDNKTRSKIAEKIDWLTENFEQITPAALSNEWTGYFKLRVGDWRVIYEANFENHQIIVVLIGHRSKVYK